MWEKWAGRFIPLFLTVTAVLGWYAAGQYRSLKALGEEERRVTGELRQVRREISRLIALPVSPLQDLEESVLKMHRIMSWIRENGLRATFTLSNPVRVTLAGVQLWAVPCRLAIQTEKLLPLLEAMRQIEKEPVLEEEWTIRPEISEMRFKILGKYSAG